MERVGWNTLIMRKPQFTRCVPPFHCLGRVERRPGIYARSDEQNGRVAISSNTDGIAAQTQWRAPWRGFGRPQFGTGPFEHTSRN